MNNALLHAMNKTHTFIDVESGQFISLPKDETDKPPVNADINGLQFFGKSTQDGEPTAENPVDHVNIPPEFNLTVCGTNLLQITDSTLSKTSNGVTITYDPITGIFSYNGTSTSIGDLFFGISPIPVKIGQKFSFKCEVIANPNNVPFQNIELVKRNPNDWDYRPFTVSHNRLFVSQTVTKDITFNTFHSYLQGAGLDYTGLKIRVWFVYGEYTSSTMPPYTNYIGNTYPYRLEDLDGNLHELCSLPDGTCDEYDVDNGVLIKRVKRLTVTSATTSEPNNIVPFYSSATDTIATIVWGDIQNKWTHSIGEHINIICSHAEHSPAKYARIPGTCDFNTTVNVTQLRMYVLKSDITDAGFTLDNAGVRAYVDKIIADTGEPITFLYPYSEPQIIPLKKYDPISFPYNQKPKSIQYHTNIFTDVGVEMQCEVRKLGNRAMGTFNWVTENGDYIVTDDNDYIMLEY